MISICTKSLARKNFKSVSSSLLYTTYSLHSNLNLLILLLLFVVRQEEISKLSRSSLMKNSKKYRQFQIQQKLEIIQKQAEKKQQQLQFQSDQQNSVIRSFMQHKQHHQKDHKMEIIKQAVSKKEMSVENANEIILQHQK